MSSATPLRYAPATLSFVIPNHVQDEETAWRDLENREIRIDALDTPFAVSAGRNKPAGCGATCLVICSIATHKRCAPYGQIHRAVRPASPAHPANAPSWPMSPFSRDSNAPSTQRSRWPPRANREAVGVMGRGTAVARVIYCVPALTRYGLISSGRAGPAADHTVLGMKNNSRSLGT